MDAVGPTHLTSAPSRPDSMGQNDARLMDVARKLEASFLSEMLKSAGVDKTPQAEEMVKTGGIGLAQSLFEALKEQGNGGR